MLALSPGSASGSSQETGACPADTWPEACIMCKMLFWLFSFVLNMSSLACCDLRLRKSRKRNPVNAAYIFFSMSSSCLHAVQKAIIINLVLKLNVKPQQLKFSYGSLCEILVTQL